MPCQSSRHVLGARSLCHHEVVSTGGMVGALFLLRHHCVIVEGGRGGHCPALSLHCHRKGRLLFLSLVVGCVAGARLLCHHHRGGGRYSCPVSLSSSLLKEGKGGFSLSSLRCRRGGRARSSLAMPSRHISGARSLSSYRSPLYRGGGALLLLLVVVVVFLKGGREGDRPRPC